MANKREDMVVALDIGTSKVVALVGEVDLDGRLSVIGIGKQPSRGMKKGVVVNIDATIDSIQRAIEEAELMAGVNIETVYCGIAGSHIRSMNSHGVVAIKEKEVTDADVDRVMDSARAIAIPADQQVIHVLPQEFIIDNQDGIRDPVGMFGVRLEARVHMVTGAQSAAQNIIKCVKRCGLTVSDIILEQVASSLAVLQDDEKELGVCIVDIGAGTTDIAIYVNGSIQHTAVIPIAGNQVTSDIAFAVRTPTMSADMIKIKHGSALRQLAGTEIIEVPSVGERAPRGLSAEILASFIEPRYEELFLMVKDELSRSGYDQKIGAGIVLTGGSSLVKGAVELAEEIFNLPVRIGMPRDIGGLKGEVENPIHSTGIGLLLYGVDQQAYGDNHSFVNTNKESFWTRFKNWLNGNL
ncbi:MAG: cell division protein FtsA [Thiotrichaceae bacterium]|nr:cell division protein FtsA [Thiotrichaceae bacterium]